MPGLEGALVDRGPMAIGALDANDDRNFEVMVAGPGALLVAKLPKLGDRQGIPARQDDKDAYDAYRLLRHMTTADAAARFRRLRADPVAGPVTETALRHLADLFATPESPGSEMAGRNVEGVGDPVFVATAVSALAGDLLAMIRS